MPILLFTSCRQIQKVFKSESPRQQYVNAIQESPLAKNKMAQQWMAAGDSVLNKPITVDVPFQTKIVYFSDETNAWTWKVKMQEGRTLRAHAARRDTSHQVFMELFSLRDGKTTLEQSADDSLITHTLDEDQTLILRVQAELLINGSATLTLTDNPSMEFPVSGGKRADIGSFWGDPRDAGRRQHEGVDIFAQRGTPVVAAANGRISRTGNRGLGGKQVWLRANGKSLYYAHLDSINSGMLEGVQKGDTLGFVGNSGNARTTPPHLHFGIYDRGAVNPLPFIDFANNRVKPITANPLEISKWARINAPKANVRPLPSTKKEPITALERNNPVKIVGATGEWYQVKLPNDTGGFIFQSLVSSATSPLKSVSLQTGDHLFKEYTDHQSMLTLGSIENATIHARHESRDLVRYKNRWMWVYK